MLVLRVMYSDEYLLQPTRIMRKFLSYVMVVASCTLSRDTIRLRGCNQVLFPAVNPKTGRIDCA